MSGPAKKKSGSAARPVAGRGGGRAGSLRPADGPDLKALWAYVILASLVLLFFYPITSGKVFVSPDSVAPAGFAKIADHALKTRHYYPLWNPYYFLGMPSFGSLAFVPYAYPPDPIFGFLNEHMGFPDLTWLLAHYLLLGFSMYAFLRVLGASRGPSILGALTLALTPNLVAVGAFGHGSQIMTAAYLPLLLLLYDRFEGVDRITPRLYRDAPGATLPVDDVVERMIESLRTGPAAWNPYGCQNTP